VATSQPDWRWVRRAPAGLRAGDPQPRLGVLGGTFNPVTRAHLALADAARREFALGEVVFVLPATLPHRAPEETTVEDRLALLQAALAVHDYFSLAVCSRGLFLDIATALAPNYPPDTRLYFLTGSDAAARILGWNYAEPEQSLAEMFARFDLIVAERAGQAALPAAAPRAAFRGQIHTLRLPAEVQKISASEVRERLRAGLPVEELVPPQVAEAIRARGLYRA
jgi:nicotinate-nucleotide adenylyltransferase